MNILMRGWNLYHKSAMAVVVAFGFSLLLRAIVSFDGGQIRTEAVIEIDRPAAGLWSLIVDPENRVRWEAHVIDMVRLSGEPGEVESTNLVFWKTPRLKRWQSLEGTLEVIPERKIAFQRQSDEADRWFTVELEPISECRTRVRFEEAFRPVRYGRRYWAFLESGSLKERLDISTGALARWAETLPDCLAEG